MPVAFDSSIQLSAEGPGRFRLPTSDAYWNMIGPYGGWSAAATLQAVLEDPRSTGLPLAATVQFMGGFDQGILDVRSEPLRVNRSTQFWQSRLSPETGGPDADPAVLAIVTLAKRRESLEAQEHTMPDVPPPEDVAEFEPFDQAPAFTRNYVHRYVKGRMFSGASDTHSLVWYRCREGSALTWAGLMSYCDVSFPRLFFRRTSFTPIATVSMSVHFHCDTEDLAAIGSDYVLVECWGRVVRGGYFDQGAIIWSRDGKLLAFSDQVMWFRTRD